MITIYALLNPFDGNKPFYVGRAANMYYRRIEHTKSCMLSYLRMSDYVKKKNETIRQILEAGLQLEYISFLECQKQDAAKHEQDISDILRANGYILHQRLKCGK